MLRFTSEPATTVRQRSRWLLSWPAYGAIFLAVVLLSCGWRVFRPRAGSDVALPQAVAQIYIHQPDFAFQTAWREILEQAKPEIRERLQIEGHASGQETRVMISLSRLPDEALAPLVNTIASAYAQACRSERKMLRAETYSAAQDRMRQAQRDSLEAQIRLELLRDRRFRAVAAARAAAPRQTTAENSRWTETTGRLAELEARRTNLLPDRTPQHPAVRDIEMRIAELSREMTSIQPRISRLPEAQGTLPPGTPAAGEIDEAQRTAEQRNQELQKAQSAERAAFTARGEELQIDLLAAEPPPPSSARAAAIIGSSLAPAASLVVGLGMICLGVSMEPAVVSVAQLQALVSAPVVGVIPATRPRRRMKPALRRFVRWGAIIAGLVMLAGCAVISWVSN
jgi:hypothetical protein